MADDGKVVLTVAQYVCQEAEEGNLESIRTVLRLVDIGFLELAPHLPRLIRAFKKGHILCVRIILAHMDEEYKDIEPDIEMVGFILLVCASKANLMSWVEDMYEHIVVSNPSSRRQRSRGPRYRPPRGLA